MPSETIDTKEILKGLLTAFDSNNSFITGHQVVRTLNAGLKRETPDWAVNDKQIRELLLRSFPKLAFNCISMISSSKTIKRTVYPISSNIF